MTRHATSPETGLDDARAPAPAGTQDASRSISRGGLLRAAFSAGMLVSLALVIGCGSTETQLQDTLARAEQYRKDGNLQAESVELRAALKLEPTNAQTNLLLARFNQRIEQKEDALFFYGEAYRLDPELHEAGVAQADMLKFEDFERAEKIIEDILARDPGHIGANRERAELRLISKDIPGALTAALTATELGPDDGMAHYTLGRIHQARIIEARRVKGEEPADALFEAAVQAFERSEAAFEETNEKLQAILLKARVYAAWPDHGEEAKEAHRRLVELSKDQNPAYHYRAVGLALKYAESSKDEDFLRWGLERMVEVQPDRVQNWRRLAKAFDDFDGTGDAIYDRLLSEQADSVDAHESYADFLVAKGEGDRAIAHLVSQQDASGLDTARLRKKLAFVHLDLVDRAAAEEVVAAMEADIPDDPNTLLARARMQLIAYKYDEARALLDRVNEGGGDAEALLYVAKLEREQGNPGAAIRALDRSQELSPDLWPERIRERMRVASAAGDHAQVDLLVREMAELGFAPTVPDQLIWIDALYALGKDQTGRALLERFLRKGNRLRPVLSYAKHEGDRNPERARTLFEESLSRKPRNRRMLVEYARFEARQGENEHAIELLDRAIAVGGRLATARTLRARLHANAGNWAQAEEDAFTAFQTNPRVRGLSDLLVQIYSKQDKLDEIVASLTEADQAGGLGADARALLGMLQVATGDADGAISNFERAIADGASQPMAKNNLAYLLAQQGQDLDRALELAQAALDDLGDSAVVTDTIGYIYHRRGLNESAVTMLKAALELAEVEGTPTADIRYHLGLSLEALGRNEDAAVEYQAALDQDPDFYGSAEARAALEKVQGAL